MSERECTDIVYIQEATMAEALRVLASHFDADPNLVLIGLWNTDPIPNWSADEGRLEVIITRMVEPPLGAGSDKETP